MFNALFSRPSDLTSERALVKACGPHVLRDNAPPPDNENEEEEDYGVHLVPHVYHQGLYFLSDIITADISPRLHASIKMDADLLVVLYRRRSYTELCNEFTITSRTTVRPRLANRNRVHNRIKVTVPVQFIREDLEPVPDFGLDARGVRLRDQVAMTGPDVDALRDQDDESDEDAQPNSVDDYLARIWRQIPVDIMSLAPNKKSNSESAHVLLPKEERDQITLGHFKTLTLSRFFEKVQARSMTPSEWRTLVFDRYFPAKKAKLNPRLQNFPKATYFIDWRQLMGRLSSSDARTVRNRVFTEFRSLAWLPYPTTDRMWCTTRNSSSSWMYYGPGTHCACPQIAINTEVAGERRVVVAAPTFDEAPVADNDEQEDDDI